jgi:hypothetical protein
MQTIFHNAHYYLLSYNLLKRLIISIINNNLYLLRKYELPNKSDFALLPMREFAQIEEKF